MGEFHIEPEEVRAAGTAMFGISEDVYDSMKTVADEGGSLGAAADLAEFSGFAEVIEATEVWTDECIPVHRADIEDLAEFLIVHADTAVANDEYVSSMFDAYADDLEPREAPAPERPGPKPEDQVPVGGESIAVL